MHFSVCCTYITMHVRNKKIMSLLRPVLHSFGVSGICWPGSEEADWISTYAVTLGWGSFPRGSSLPFGHRAGCSAAAPPPGGTETEATGLPLKTLTHACSKRFLHPQQYAGRLRGGTYRTGNSAGDGVYPRQTPAGEQAGTYHRPRRLSAQSDRCPCRPFIHCHRYTTACKTSQGTRCGDDGE